VLDQERGEAFVSSKRCAVNDINRVLAAVLADIAEPKRLGRQEVELIGRDGVFGAITLLISKSILGRRTLPRP